MRDFLSKALLCILFGAVLAVPSSANAQKVNLAPLLSAAPSQSLQPQDVTFSFSQSGTAFQIARTALRHDLSELEDDIGRNLVLFTAREDLLGDETPEIFVKLADKKIFCDSYGNCPIRLLKMSEDGPVEIGQFTAKEIAILKPKGQKQRNSSAFLGIQTTAYLPEKQVTRYTVVNGRYVSDNANEQKSSQGEEKQ